jgi:hypothetical protein
VVAVTLILDGVLLGLPSVETKCYANDPTIPRTTDGRARRREDVAGIVLHTVTARPHQPPVLPGSRPSEHAERLARYQAHAERKVSWHYTVDTDGTVVQSADPATWLCWHAGGVNPWTVGIELCQGPGGALYEVQMTAMVKLVDHLCAAFGIARRYPVRASTGRPHGGVIPRLEGNAAPWDGVFGHRNQTPQKPHGDPGDAPFAALAAAGFTGVAFP